MHQIRYFLAVRDTLNFTRAAKQRAIVEPEVTRTAGPAMVAGVGRAP